MKLKGEGKLIKALKELRHKPGPYRKALMKFLLRVERNSAKRVPVDTGKLRSSGLGNANVYKSDAYGAEGSVYYSANYALHVHERTDIKHKPPTEAKFLENAVKEESGKMKEVIGKELKGNIFHGG